jgi:hypothetical protein
LRWPNMSLSVHRVNTGQCTGKSLRVIPAVSQ